MTPEEEDQAIIALEEKGLITFVYNDKNEILLTPTLLGVLMADAI